MTKPVIAIVGRPNVGKSTLFNRISGERLAVVDSIPGTTRDRLFANAEWAGNLFYIVDTGGIDPTRIQNQEPLSIASKDFIPQIREQAEMAVKDADAVIFLVDAESGLTPADFEIATILRRTRSKEINPPVLIAVNKCENQARRDAAIEFYELGMGQPVAISALHGTSVGDLLDQVFNSMGARQIPQDDIESTVRIAIVGRPNVGKSSLLNRLLGEDRVIVSPIPGTTRDAIDTKLAYYGQQITLIDTAGIRKRGRIEPGVEKFSVIRAFKAVERADVVLFLLDGIQGIIAQDAHIAGMVLEHLKSVIVLVNKWDAVEKDTHTMAQITTTIRQELNFLDYVPILFISALSGKNTHQIIPTALRVQQERFHRISTGELNRIIHHALDHHAPPSKAGKRLKILYTSQVSVNPPVILFHVNDRDLVHFSYQRYLENQIRAAYPFEGTPIKMVFRNREQAERD
ncbi:MAG: ribosome biogenesis GTPase Der [Anaerolineales bacterium]|nr:ribosome biogenesis GTPase Der [Anaerolineales bacterium]